MGGICRRYRRIAQIMSNMWLLSKMRCPGRPLFADLDENVWWKFLENKVLAPGWNAGLEYEFQMTKEALKLTRESHIPIQAALWTAYEDPQHRMRNWISLLTLANAKEEQDSSEFAAVKRRLASVGQAQGRASKAQKTQHNPEGGSNAASSQGKGSGKSQTSKKLLEVSANSRKSPRKHFHAGDRQPPYICHKFRRHVCEDPACTRSHMCVGCGKQGVAHDDCGCLESVLSNLALVPLVPGPVKRTSPDTAIHEQNGYAKVYDDKYTFETNVDNDNCDTTYTNKHKHNMREV